MSDSKSGMNRDSYLSKNIGDFSDNIEFAGRQYQKVEDLRYGTNPHQPAAFYKPEGIISPIGDMKILKNGKSGLSQTNLEDISYALNIVKFFDIPACAVMKHVNPSGAAVQCGDESVKDVYIKARDCDARAAFGSAIAFNVPVDIETAKEIMGTFVECVVAPSYEDGVLEIFNDNETYKFNKHVRIIEAVNFESLPKYTGETSPIHNSIKVLADGCLVVAAPLTTSLKSVADLKIAEAENKRCGVQKSEKKATEQQMNDLLTAWYINLNVRSNGVVIVKDGQTISVGTGEQDRVGAVEQAIWKYNNKYEGEATLQDAVMASDGFFPFEDGVEVAAEAGITAIIAPAGSLRDADVIKRANELGVALIHAPERIFSHH
jgi:phosphoribosylaminoimidazolecarboxamide formyltransferase/IMP cyclohydrolase